MNISIERFDGSGDSTEMGAKWNVWIQRFKVFAAANDWEEDLTIKNRFLSFLDNDSFTVYCGLKKADDTDTYTEIVKLMTAYYNPTGSHFASRYTFNQLSQREGEKTNDFVTRLRRQATMCDFKTELDMRILEQLVAGSNNIEFRQFCLTNMDKLDLDKALKRARDQETAQVDLQRMSKAKSSNEINFIRHTSSRKNHAVSPDHKRDSILNKRVTFTSNRDTCSYCGRSEHMDKN